MGEPVQAASAVIVDRSRRVLLVRRGRAPLAGSWTLPGGRIELGETPEQAVVREVAEETGMAVTIVASLGEVVLERREGGVEHAFVIHEFRCAPVDPCAAPRAGDDAIDVRWAREGELRALGVNEEARAVVQAALAGLRSRSRPRLR